MKPRPILYVHHRSELSGAALALALLIRHVDRTKWEAHVYTPSGPAADLFRAEGAVVHTGPVSAFTHIWASTYHGLRWLLLLRELVMLPGHLRALARVLNRYEFALVHLNDSPLLGAARLASRRGLPVVWHLRSALAETGRARSVVQRAVHRFATATVAINDDVARSFRVETEVIHDSVDLERFTPGDPRDARSRLGLPPDRQLVTAFGYLYPAKGFRQFLQAAALLPNATFAWIGGGVRSRRMLRRLLRADYEREARRLIAELGIADRALLVPYVEDTSHWYRASDAVAIPSQGPEIGLPAIEAAASGVPTVATGTSAGGGVVLPGHTGLLATAGDGTALAEALGGLLADRVARAELGAAGRAHAQARFDAARNAESVQAVYDEVAGASSSARGASAARTG